MSSLTIRDTIISSASPTYFIAEIGSNFDGSLDKAFSLIRLAAESSANAVKFQHYTARSLVSDYGFNSLGSQVGHQALWSASVYDTYDKASLNLEWTAKLSDYAHSFGLDFITSPYSFDLLDDTVEYIDAIKIGSGDITYLPLIERATKYDKPILLATGASSLHEVKEAADILANNIDPFCLMQCNTNYQSALGDAHYQNVNCLTTFGSLYPEAVLGLSCHAPYDMSVLLAVALGARIVEKHFTDSNENPGPDHGFALDPVAFSGMVKNVRFAETVLGSAYKKVEANEIDTIVVQRRSIRASMFIPANTVLTSEHIVCLRPCPPSSLPPSRMSEILGKVTSCDIMEGQSIELSSIQVDV